MAVNDLILRARDYVYDKEGFPDFVEELLAADPDDLHAVVEYLSGHSLAIARWRSAPGQVGPWFWLDPNYLPSITKVLAGQKRALEVIGRGRLETAQDIARLGFPQPQRPG